MYPDPILLFSRERRLSQQDAAQTFLQVVVLRHLSDPAARFMGGTALVLGYGNPRFSEDVDLTQVKDPERLRPGLVKARAEIEGWFGAPVVLQAPKSGRRTWRLTVRLGRAESLSLHVDSQPFRAYTSRPLVVEYPSLTPFVCEGLDLEEIMAEKVIALALRRYLGGRDLFDLWFHWLRSETAAERAAGVGDLLNQKLRERSIRREELKGRLLARLSEGTSLIRAREEWRRYLPADFQRPSVQDEIVKRCRLLGGLVS